MYPLKTAALPSRQPAATSRASTSSGSSSLKQAESWKNIDHAFPPFATGVHLSSVYERAGFDTNRGNNQPSRAAKPRSPAPEPPLRSRSRSSSQASSQPTLASLATSESSAQASPALSSFSLPLPQQQQQQHFTDLEPVVSATPSHASKRSTVNPLRFLHKSPSAPALDKASISSPSLRSSSAFFPAALSSFSEPPPPTPAINFDTSHGDSDRGALSQVPTTPERVPVERATLSPTSVYSLDHTSPNSQTHTITTTTPLHPSQPQPQPQRTPGLETTPGSATSAPLSSLRLSSPSSSYSWQPDRQMSATSPGTSATAPTTTTTTTTAPETAPVLPVAASPRSAKFNYKSLVNSLSALQLNVLPEEGSEDTTTTITTTPSMMPLPYIDRQRIPPTPPLKTHHSPPLKQDSREELRSTAGWLSAPPSAGSGMDAASFASRSSSTTSSLFSASPSHASSEYTLDSAFPAAYGRLPSPTGSAHPLLKQQQQQQHTQGPPPLQPPPVQAPARVHAPTPPPAPPAASRKGPCRGCGQAITGKSVSSRDGSLTGRWHRACFACSGCGTRDFGLPLEVLSQFSAGGALVAPTSETEFYILDDLPYCHLCYHSVNNSVCGVCSLGIEGRCLDDGASRYHAACAVCTTCREPLLADDGETSAPLIFVSGEGRLYCAEHAGGTDAQPGMERRTTRLFFV